MPYWFCQMHNIRYPPLKNYPGSLTVLKITCVLPLYPPLTTPNSHDFFVSIVFPLPECHVVGIIQYITFQIDFFHLVICIWVSSTSFHVFIAYFFLVLNDTPLCGCSSHIFTCWGTSWLLPSFGDYEWSCYKQLRKYQGD